MARRKVKGIGFYFEYYNARAKRVSYGYVSNITEKELINRFKKALRQKKTYEVAAAWKSHPGAVGYSAPYLYMESATMEQKKYYVKEKEDG